MTPRRRKCIGVLLVSFLAFTASAAPQRPRSRVIPSSTSDDLMQSAISALSSTPRALASCGYAGALSCTSNTSGSANSCTSGEYYFDFWNFAATAGKPFTVTVSSSYTTYPILVAVQSLATGDVLKSNYAYGTTNLTFTPGSSTTYIISVGFVAKYYSRSYTVRVTCDSTPQPTCQTSGTIQRGVPFTADLGTNTACSADKTSYSKLLEFTGTEDTPVRITASGHPLYIDAYSEDSWTGEYRYYDKTDATQTFVYYPEKSGKQYLWVTHDSDQPSTGQFMIVIEDEPLDPCRRRSTRH